MSRFLLLCFLLLSSAGCSWISGVNTNRLDSNESAAKRSLSMTGAAQAQFYSMKNRYASQLSELGPSGADLIPADLASGTKSGYHFQLSGDAKSYKVTAIPGIPGTSGRRTYFMDETLIVRSSDGPEPAGPASPEVK